MIYTFYSYKGGVGRTMALANVAQLFVEAGLNVIVIDWDLEAPGLERYFFEDTEVILKKKGVIDLLLEYKSSVSDSSRPDSLSLPDLEQYLSEITVDSDSPGRLFIMTSGNRSENSDSSYTNSVLSFDWYDFYKNWEGEGFFEWFRKELERLTDVILIDSRTGLTEVSGPSTYQLADVIVMFCAPNRQNIEGTIKMANGFMKVSGSEVRRNRKLEVLVVPSRVDKADSRLVDEFQKDFEQRFKDTVPRSLPLNSPKLWELNLPYSPKYSFNEKIAYQRDERTRASAEDIVRAVERLSQSLAFLSHNEEVKNKLLMHLGIEFEDEGRTDVPLWSYTPPPPPNPHDPLPAPGPLPPGSRLPFGRNELFTGREEDLRALAATLLPTTNDQRRTTPSELVTRHSSLVTSGIGGVGKTQLAVEFAHRYGRFFHGVHWVSLENPDAVAAEIALCGAEMRLRPDYDALPAEAQVRETLAAWAGPEARLLIFDNCEEPPLLARWRPSSGGARLLVTSRNTLWPPEYGLAARRVHPLPRVESRALLREYLEAAAGDPAAVAGQRSAVDLDRVAAAVGDLPLALALAGHYLARYRRVTVDDYLAALRGADDLLPVGRGAASPTGHDLSVWRTFAVSFDKLDAGDEVDAAALALLACAACFAPGEPLPEDLLLAAMDEEAREQHILDDALLRLLELGLLQEARMEVMRLHRLIVRFAAGALAEAMDAAQAAVEGAVFSLANKQNRAGYPQALRKWEIHLRHVTDAAFSREDNKTANLCNEMGYYLQMSGDLPAARPYLERALAVRERVLGPDHPDTAVSLNNLGSLLRAMGDLHTARAYFERALAIDERALGPEHPDTASSLNNLGMLLRSVGELPAAQPYFIRALTIFEHTLGSESSVTALSLNNLGSLLQAMGDLPAARPYFERALAINERALGPDHPDTALSLNNLGGLLHALGDLPAARPYYERALAIWERVLGPDHPNTAASLNNLGFLLQAMGDLPAARPYLERVLSPDHSNTALSLWWMGVLSEQDGEREKAREFYARALAVFEKRLGPDHPNAQGIKQFLSRVS